MTASHADIDAPVWVSVPAIEKVVTGEDINSALMAAVEAVKASGRQVQSFRVAPHDYVDLLKLNNIMNHRGESVRFLWWTATLHKGDVTEALVA